MGKNKGISIVNIRSLFAKYPEMEKTFLSRLSDELKTLYTTSITATWNPCELQNEIFKQAADVLFPGEAQACELLGKMVAEMTYTGIYKIFFKIPSPEFLIKRWVNLWFLHHDSGTPAYEKIDEKHYDLYVNNYPTLPPEMRRVITGHLLKVMEMIGATRPEVVLDESNPMSWKWSASLEGMKWKKPLSCFTSQNTLNE